MDDFGVAETPSESTLATLLGPLERDRFLRDFWPKRYVATHGPLARLKELAELDVLQSPEKLLAANRGRAKVVLSDDHHNFVSAKHAEGLFGGGASICLTDVNHWQPVLARWSAALTRELGTPPARGRCNIYVSPAGKGLGRHFDAHEVFIVQLVGAKRWIVAANEDVLFPTQNYSRVDEAAKEMRLYSASDMLQPNPGEKREPIDMKPGSVLFLPRGTWHETEAEEASLSLTFGVRTPMWLDVLMDAIRFRLLQHGRWREPAVGGWGDDPQRDAALKRLGEILPELGDDLGRLTPEAVLDSYPYLWKINRHAPSEPRLQRRLALADGLRLRISTQGADDDSVIRIVHVEHREGARAELEVPPAAVPLIAWLSERSAPFDETEAAAASSLPAWAVHRILDSLIEHGALQVGAGTGLDE